MYTVSTDFKPFDKLLVENMTVFDGIGPDEELDKSIMDFILEYYNVPNSIRENTTSIAQIPKHKVSHLYLTHNKPFEPNESIIMVILGGEFADKPFYKISQEEFEEIQKTKISSTFGKMNLMVLLSTTK